LTTIVLRTTFTQPSPSTAFSAPVELFNFRRRMEPTQISLVDGNIVAVNAGTLWIRLESSGTLVKSGILKDNLGSICGNTLQKLFVCRYGSAFVYVYSPRMKIPGVN
jgi:hypothetical protein